MQFLSMLTLERLNMISEASHIPYIVLKGPHLAWTVYDNPSERAWTDLDILVPTDSYHQFFLCLQNDGFKPITLLKHRAASHAAYYCYEFSSPLGLYVELHKSLVPYGWWPVNVNGLFERAEPFLMDKVAVQGLGTENLLFHLCLHIIKSHFWVEEKHFRDIGQLINKRNICWDDFMSLVRSAKCKSGCYFILRSAMLQHGSIVPEYILRQLKPKIMRNWWLTRFLNPAHFPLYRYPCHSPQAMAFALHFPLMDRMRDWIPLALSYLRLRLLDVYYSFKRPIQPFFVI